MFEGSFSDFLLPKALKQGLQDLDYKTPTKVQHAVFNHVLQGQDLIVKSHTGSGKTTAFCLPLLVRITEKSQTPLAIVLAPTRELAKQVATECQKLSAHQDISVACIYGGVPFEGQIKSLNENCQIVVGTPGRIKDLIKQGLLQLSKVKFAVLDEADEMLSMGFWEDVLDILSKTPKKKQTLLFSATMPNTIQSSANSLLKEPFTVDLSENNHPVQSIKQIVHKEDENLPKARNLLYALEYNTPKSTIVFCNTREETDVVYRYLKRFGFDLAMLSGELSQNKREQVMAKIKSGEISLLIATDVAARGIDIEDLSHVFHFSLPENKEVFVHRSGRTGRTGKDGVSVSLIRDADYKKVDDLKKRYNLEFEEIALPKEEELFKLQGERLAHVLQDKAAHVEISQFKPIANEILTHGNASQSVAFLLKEYLGQKTYTATFWKDSNCSRGAAQNSRNNQQQSADRNSDREKAPVRARRQKAKNPVSAKNKTSETKTTPMQVQPTGNGPANIYISFGRTDGFSNITVLADHVAKLSGVDLGSFTGGGNIRDQSSHIEVDNDVAAKIVESLHGKNKKANDADVVGETIKCEIAYQTERRRPYRPRLRT